MRSALITVVPRAVVMFRALWVVNAAVAIVASAATDRLTIGQGAVALVTMLWVALAIVMTQRSSRPPTRLAVADLALFAVLLVAAPLLLPASLVGDSTSWIGTGASISVLIAGWLLSVAGALGATAVITTAYLTGVTIIGRESLTADHFTTAVQLLLQGSLGIASIAVIRASTRRAEDALQRRVATEHADYVHDSVVARTLEQQSTLHDEVQHIFWLIGGGYLGGQAARARERAAAATASLRDLIAGRNPPDRRGALLDRIRAVAKAATVNVDLTLAETSAHQRPPAGAGHIPAVVADAVVRATREALANVTHANVDRASVRAEHSPSSVNVVIRDHGIGFDPTAPTDGQGVRDSIQAAMSQIGGSATIDSAPGRGTMWTLRWTGGTRLAPSTAVRQAAAGTYRSGFLSVFVIIAAGFHLFALYHLLTRDQDYRSGGLALMSWLAITLAAVALMGGIDRAWMTPGIARLALGTVVLASVAVGVACQPWGVVGFANWGVGEVGWFVGLATAYLSVREVIVVWVIAAAANLVTILAVSQDASGVIAKVIGIVLGFGVLQAGAAIAFIYMRASAGQAGEDAWRASEIIAHRAVEDEAARHREQLLRQVDEEMVTLLASIADGTADPDSPTIQLACKRAGEMMRCCNVLRRSKALDLVPVILTGARLGLDFRLPVVESLDDIPFERRAELVRMLVDLVSATRAGDAVLTVQRGIALTGSPGPTEGAVSVSLAVPIAPGTGPLLRSLDPDGYEVALELSDDDGDAGDAEATWAWLAAVYRP
jgi:hypothetical protein